MANYLSEVCEIAFNLLVVSKVVSKEEFKEAMEADNKEGDELKNICFLLRSKISEYKNEN